MTDERVIAKTHLHEVCKVGQGAECCRYVVAGADGITCAKKTSMRHALDDRVDRGLMHAQSDNCPGLPLGLEGQFGSY